MADVGPIANGLLGIRRGLGALRQSAADIAGAGHARAPQSTDLAPPLVNLTAHRTQVQASAEVVETAGDLLGRLFDDRA